MRCSSLPRPDHYQAPVLAPTDPGLDRQVLAPLVTHTLHFRRRWTETDRIVRPRFCSRETRGTTPLNSVWQWLWGRHFSSSTFLPLLHCTTNVISDTRCDAIVCLLRGAALPMTWPTVRRKRSCLCRWSTQSTMLTTIWNLSGHMTSCGPPVRLTTHWHCAVPRTMSHWWLQTPSPWSPVPSPACSLFMLLTLSPLLATTTPCHTRILQPGYSTDCCDTAPPNDQQDWLCCWSRKEAAGCGPLFWFLTILSVPCCKTLAPSTGGKWTSTWTASQQKMHLERIKTLKRFCS